MLLHSEMSLEEVTDEATRRVVRFGPRSPEARELLRYAKKYLDSQALKVVRFKIAQQERFDVDHKLAGPWVRTLHFLDEEVFDRLRLNNIGQVLAVTALVIGVVVVSDGTRNLFRPGKPTETRLRISDVELSEAARSENSPVDAWVNQVFARALNNPEFLELLREKVEKSTVGDTQAASPGVVAAVDSSLPPADPDQFAKRVLTQFQSAATDPTIEDETLRILVASPEFREMLVSAIRSAATATHDKTISDQ